MTDHRDPLTALIGKHGDPPACRAFSETVAVHWFATDAQPGDRCLCGNTTMDRLAPDEVEQ